MSGIRVASGVLWGLEQYWARGIVQEWTGIENCSTGGHAGLNGIGGQSCIGMGEDRIKAWGEGGCREWGREPGWEML